MKDRIATFSLRGRVDIWQEYVKNVTNISEERVTWIDFERLSRKKSLSERYYNDREKVLYELKMGPIIDEEYTSRLLELLRYVSYLKSERAKIERFISGLLITFGNRIDFYEPRFLEEAIEKIKFFYEKSKKKYE